MTPLLRRRPGLRWPLAVAALSLAALAQVQSMRAQDAAPPADDDDALAVLASLTLHGDTPSMSWSPDTRRVVVGGAYTYLSRPQPGDAAVGVFVLDVAGGQATRVDAEQGYHPLWLDDHSVAWGRSPYESVHPGLFTASLRQDPVTPQRVGLFEGVYHTLPAGNGEILYYSGFPAYEDWMLIDPRTQQRRKAPLPQGNASSWDPPRGQVVPQCLRAVGDVRVSAEDGDLVLHTPRGRHVLTSRPYVFSYYEAAHDGPVLPCLSGDGEQVAYFTEAPGGYRLEVVAVPR